MISLLRNNKATIAFSSSMKIGFAIIIAFYFLLKPSYNLAQSREMGLMMGVMGYKGDLNPVMFSDKFLHPGVGIIYRVSYNNHWSFRAGLNYGRIAADDALASDSFSINRNLSFRSDIIELQGGYEFNFFPYQTANPATFFTPYLFIGLNVFRFNPKANLNGEWYALQPLGTEGQGTEKYKNRKPYSRVGVNLPFGGGFKIKLTRRFSAVLEMGVRRCWTDYLDDTSKSYADPVSIRKEYGKIAVQLADRSLEKGDPQIGRQRGNSTDKDWYWFGGVQVCYTLSKKYIDSCRPFRIKFW